jgi:Na+/proline symporter
MKRGMIILVILIVLAAALGAGWWWTRKQPAQVTEFLIGGGLEASQAEAFVGWLSWSPEALRVQK